MYRFQNGLPLLRVLALATALAACGGAPMSAAPLRPTGSGGGIELRREQLDPLGSLLASLDRRVNNLDVLRPVSDCPVLLLRGRGPVSMRDQPSVYVDGTRVHDTCFLDMMKADQVERVTVFNGPASARPGLFAGQGGIIVIETRIR